MNTPLEREIEVFLLRALHAAQGSPMTDTTLRQAVTSAFQHVALTAADIGDRIGSVEEKNFIAGTNDEVFGLMWALTPKGKIRAQQLPR